MLSLAIVVGYEASILTEANTDSSPALGRDQDASCGRGVGLLLYCWAGNPLPVTLDEAYLPRAGKGMY